MGEEAGHYHMLRKGGLEVAGLGPAQPGQPTAWSTYLAVDDIDAAVAKATAAGGTSMMPVMDVFEAGPDDVRQRPGRRGGRAVAGEGRRSVRGSSTSRRRSCGTSCMTRDLEAAKAFYTAVAGWDYTPMEGPSALPAVPGCRPPGRRDDADAGRDAGGDAVALDGRTSASPTPTPPPAAPPSSAAPSSPSRSTPPSAAPPSCSDSTGATFSIITLTEASDPNEGWND